MIVCRTKAELRAALSELGSVALVPTMGAFHEGHLHLMRVAANYAPTIAVSLFVNPTQFAPTEDLSKYPRNEEEDFRLAQEAGVGLMFAPSAEDVYGSATTQVVVAGSALGFEGDVRPSHFNGVATIVLKLFQLFQPDYAIFGWKDLQQCAVIRQMVRDLDVPVNLVFEETVREETGLALSSRNRYLAPDQRRDAAFLHSTLRVCAQRLAQGEDDWHTVLSETTALLEQKGFAPDYLAVVNPDTMERLNSRIEGARLVTAARYCGVRLLDNLPLP